MFKYHGGLQVRYGHVLTKEMVKERLTSAVSTGRVIELCRNPPNGELYERAALAFRPQAHTPTTDDATDQTGLIRYLGEYDEPKKLGCELDGCALHPRPPLRFGMWI